MRRLVFSTDDVPEAERFAFWRESISGYGVSAERGKDWRRPFDAKGAASFAGPLARFRIKADAYAAVRRSSEIARRNWDDRILLSREFCSPHWMKIGREEFVVRPGDLVVAEVAAPVASVTSARWDSEGWLLPRELLEPHLPPDALSRAVVLRAGDGVTGLVMSYLDAVAGQLDRLDDLAAGVVADSFCRLLAVARGANGGEHEQPVRFARLEKAKRYVGLHLADPKLTPEKTASALGISVRQLHLLFEPSGTSFAQYVLKRRLEECRRALMNPGSDRSVTDVALAWGFGSVATFNRNFQRAFGVAPGEIRRAGAFGAVD